MNQKHLSVVCKHKHMLKNGAPPGNFGILHHLYSEILWFEETKRILYVIFLGSWYYFKFLTEGMVPFNNSPLLKNVTHLEEQMNTKNISNTLMIVNEYFWLHFQLILG